MAHDALGAHARDELGITEIVRARPVQAALASAASFAVGAALPLAMVLVAPRTMSWLVVAVSLMFLAILGAIASRAGGAKLGRRAARDLLGRARDGDDVRRRRAVQGQRLALM